MTLGRVAGVLEVGEGGRAQQVSDQVQLLDRRRGLQRRDDNFIFKLRIIQV